MNAAAALAARVEVSTPAGDEFLPWPIVVADHEHCAVYVAEGQQDMSVTERPEVGAAAVVARPDADKGEQLIAATNKAELELGEIREAITAAGLPNLAAPREIKVLDEIPLLGSGKVNYPELSQQVNEA